MRQPLRQLWQTVGKWSGYIPKGTTVDPAHFPEAEYPVWCLTCGYELRGLSDGKCPECGREFDRGPLLVDTYARWRKPKADKYRRASKSLFIVFLAITVGWELAIGAVQLWIKIEPDNLVSTYLQRNLPERLRVIVFSAFLVQLIAVIAGSTAATIEIATARPKRKREAVAREARKRVYGT